uniref:Glycosyl transferase group 1 protein n=1 Tax=uncultured bacterium 89 TaxID=698393 RepID=E3T691_9BACT|nr:glycosyl transferase group 1 protein [uncultured bacterium 89]
MVLGSAPLAGQLLGAMPRPLNFLHVTTFYPPYNFGGDGIYVQRLAYALGDQGHHVDIVHCVDAFQLAARPNGFSPSPHPNVTVHALKSPVGWLSPLASHQTGRPFFKQPALQALVDAKPYDVIHFHNISLFGPEVLRIGGSSPLKLYTTHEYWLICPTHVLRKFNREPCREPECLQCVIRSLRPPQPWRYTGLLADSVQHVDQFLAPSRFTAQIHAERGFTAPICHLPNFCDRSDQDWLNPGESPHHRPYFLYAGRLEDEKGPQTLIPFWDRVAGFDLVVAGSGRQEMMLGQMAAANPRIRFLGNVPPAKIGRLFAHAAAVIIPSVVYEVFSLVAVESMARKTPVIARDLGGLTELAEDSGGAVLYRTDDELLQAIHSLGADPQLRRETGERGYQHYLAHYTREAHLKAYGQVIAEAAARKFGKIPWGE